MHTLIYKDLPDSFFKALNPAYRVSKSSRVVAIRLPNDIYDKIERRVKGPRSRWGSVAEWVLDEIIYRAQRKPYSKAKAQAHERRLLRQEARQLREQARKTGGPEAKALRDRANALDAEARKSLAETKRLKKEREK